MGFSRSVRAAAVGPDTALPSAALPSCVRERRSTRHSRRSVLRLAAMFTGLVAAVGVVQAVTRSGAESDLAVDLAGLPGPFRIGDSIALSGVCCTVVAL